LPKKEKTDGIQESIVEREGRESEMTKTKQRAIAGHTRRGNFRSESFTEQAEKGY